MMTWQMFLALEPIFCKFCVLLPSMKKYNLTSSNLFIAVYYNRTYSRRSTYSSCLWTDFTLFTFAFSLNDDSTIRDNGVSLRIFKGGTNILKYCKVGTTGFKNKS